MKVKNKVNWFDFRRIKGYFDINFSIMDEKQLSFEEISELNEVLVRMTKDAEFVNDGLLLAKARNAGILPKIEG